MFRRLAAALLLRRVSGDLHALRVAVEQQNVWLARLVERLAPSDPDTAPTEVAADTGVSFLDPTDSALAAAYSARVLQDTGHTPDDDEVLAYLADEKTHDLHARFLEREVVAMRIARERLARGPR